MTSIEHNSNQDLLERFRGKSLQEILSREKVTFKKRALSVLANWEQSLQQAGSQDGAVFELGRRYIDGESLTSLAKQTDLNIHTLEKLFRNLGIPTRTQSEAIKAKWQDPDFRRRHAEGNQTLWQDPKFRERHAETNRAILEEKWQDPEFRERQAEATRANWQDPEFRRRISEADRANWQDPDFRRRHAEAVTAKWQDPEFRRRNAEGVRQARLNPDNFDRYVMPTIFGERWDIGFAQSAWEANLARVIRFVGREYLPHESLRLVDGSLFELDFLTLDNRGRIVGYEIMAHPTEHPRGWERLERAIIDHPEIVFRTVDRRFYDRLKNIYADRINSDLRFAGWEEGRDNLRNNPAKYSV